MTLQTPTTQDISDNIIAQLEATLSQTIPLLPKAFLRVLAKVLAGVFILLYKYGGFMYLSMFVQTAQNLDTEVNGIIVNPLVAWGRLIGVGDPVAATQAELLIDITVELQVGSLPSGTQLVNTVSGVTYITIGVVLLNAAIVQGTARAASDQAGNGGVGTIGNMLPGEELAFAQPVPNVNQVTTVASQLVTAADAESTENYRQRVIDRFQKRPQGGAYSDYELWGEEVAGIINVYPYTSANPGQVDVFVEATEASSGNADGIATPAQLIAVFDSIEQDNNGLANRRPANAFVNVFAITRVGFEVTITNLVVDDLAQVQTDIEEAVKEYFLNAEPFIAGLSVLPRNDRISNNAITGLVESIVNSFGGTYAGVIMTLSGNPILIYSLQEGEKAKATSVSFA